MPVRMVIRKKKNDNNVSKDVEKRESLYTVEKNIN
jgi:hypothetical protein